MDTNLIITIVALLIAIVTVSYAYWRSGRPVTLEGVVESAKQAVPIAEDANSVLSAIVLGVDQLIANGDIKTDGEAFKKAFAVAKKHHLFQDYDPEVLATLIEGAYNSTLGRNRAVAPIVTPVPRTEGQLLADFTEQQLASGSIEGKPSVP